MAVTRSEDYYSVSEIKLSYRTKIKASNRPAILCSRDSYEIFRRHWEDDQLDFVEHAKLLLLNRANRVLGICNISTGSTTGTVVDTRLVFAAALKANASSIVLGHNHPSESLEPSAADKRLTEQLEVAGSFMNVPLLDHIVVGRYGYYSFSDQEQYGLDELPHLKTGGPSKFRSNRYH